MDKRIITIVIIILIGGGLYYMNQSNNKDTGDSKEVVAQLINPGVTIEPNTQPLGEVLYGDVATTTFTLTNNTQEDLNITKVSTSCGCTSATVENTLLKPYESTIVYVSFDPAVHKDDTDLGELTRTIYIDTDSINFETVSSTITANVTKK